MNSQIFINVKAILLPPYINVGYGGFYTPIANFNGPIEINAFSIESFVRLFTEQAIDVAGIKCRFVSVLDTYNAETNTITLRSGAVSLDDDFVEKAKSAGWVFDEEVLRRHRWRGAVVSA